MSEDREIIGRYQVLRPLAQGGMAEIFLARQEGPAGFGKTVVIKRVLSHLATDEGFIQMFKDEAVLASQLSHPNIVQIFDFGEDDGTYYLSMEYLAGEDAAAIIRQAALRGRPVPPQIAALICSHVLEGLHYAHTLVGEDGEPLGIVHRDVSPSNVMVTYQGSVKVLDFGIAKAAGKIVKTQVGTVKGKFMYMSPEQARGRPLDGRSDVFALGAVLYEMLTGVRLFQRENQMATLLAVTEQPVPSPRQHRPDLPTEIEEILMRALEKDPAGRFSSALTMREALDEYLAMRTYAPSHVQLRQFLLDLFGREHVAKRQKLPGASPGSAAAVDTAVKRSAGSKVEHQGSEPKKRVIVGLGSDEDEDEETIVPLDDAEAGGPSPPPAERPMEAGRKPPSRRVESKGGAAVGLGDEADPDEETLVPAEESSAAKTPAGGGDAFDGVAAASSEDDVDVALDEDAIGDMPTRLVSIADIEAKASAERGSRVELRESGEEEDAFEGLGEYEPESGGFDGIEEDYDLDPPPPKRPIPLALGLGAGAGLAAAIIAALVVFTGGDPEDLHEPRPIGRDQPRPASLEEQAGAADPVEPSHDEEEPFAPEPEQIEDPDAGAGDEPEVEEAEHGAGDVSEQPRSPSERIGGGEAPEPAPADQEPAPSEPEAKEPTPQGRTPAGQREPVAAPRPTKAETDEGARRPSKQAPRTRPTGTKGTGQRPRQQAAAAERERPPPEQEAAGGHGTLMVNCIPWCQIFINDRDIDRTSPARDIRLSVGRHRLKVVHPPTGMERFEDVEIRPDEETVAVVRF